MRLVVPHHLARKSGVPTAHRGELAKLSVTPSLHQLRYRQTNFAAAAQHFEADFSNIYHALR